MKNASHTKTETIIRIQNQSAEFKIPGEGLKVTVTKLSQTQSPDKYPKQPSIHKPSLKSLTEEDLQILASWRRSPERRVWEKSILILGVQTGRSTREIAFQIDRHIDTVKKWKRSYRVNGLKAFLR
jgi:hypothetical protein